MRKRQSLSRSHVAWLLFTLILLLPTAAYADGELIEYQGREKDIHPMLIGAVLGAVIFVSFKLAGWIANMGRKKDEQQ